MTTKPDDVLDEILEKLGQVSPKYENTFAYSPAVDPRKYAALQRLINDYGYDRTRAALERALALRIVPNGRSAYPLIERMCSW